MRRRRTLATVIAGGALAVSAGFAGALLAPAPPASAHNYVVDATPAADEALTELPENFVITTNEPLLDIDGTASGFALQVSDADGAFYGDGCVTVSGASMSVDAPQLGAAGDYELAFQFVSADGHTVSERYSFTWDPAADYEPAEGVATAPNCGRETDAGADGDDGTGDTEGTGEADDASDASAVALGDILWIGGAVLAVLIAGAVTLIVVRRRG